MGLPPHTPLGDFIPKPHLRFAAVKSSFYAPAVRQVTLRSLTAFSVSLRVGRRLGCRPNLPEGILPSDSHLRFAAVKSSFRVPAVRQVSLRSLTAFSVSLRVGDDWAAAQTCLREFFPQTPISASRRLKAAFVCQPSVRFRFAP